MRYRPRALLRAAQWTVETHGPRRRRLWMRPRSHSSLAAEEDANALPLENRPFPGRAKYPIDAGARNLEAADPGCARTSLILGYAIRCAFAHSSVPVPIGEYDRHPHLDRNAAAAYAQVDEVQSRASVRRGSSSANSFSLSCHTYKKRVARTTLLIPKENLCYFTLGE